MGFTSESPYVVGYVTANAPYICLGANAVNVSRTSSMDESKSAKFRMSACFEVYYNLADRELKKPMIDHIYVSESVNDLAPNLVEWAYAKVKADKFDGQVLTDV